MSTPKLFGKDILITSTTEASSNTIGTLATLGGINVSKTIMTAGGINSVSNTNTLGNLFTTGGNIGINTTAPTQALSVNGNLNFTGSLFQNGSVYSGSTQWGSTGANIYFNTGNVGIGMTGASSVLSISGSSSSGMLRLYPNTNRGEASIGFYENTTSGNSWVMGPNGWSVGTSFQIGYSGAPVSGPVMTLTTIGNIGIGTTSPSALMYINSNNTSANRSTSLYIKTPQAGLVLDSTSTTNGKAYNIWSTAAGDSPGPGSLGFFDIQASTYRMLIGSTGNIGIGTFNPSDLLNVSNGNISLSSDTATHKGILVNQNSVWSGFEVEGLGSTPGAQVVNMFVNSNRSKTWNSSSVGGWFRIDTRDTSSLPLFQWYKKDKTGGGETMMMTLHSTGNLGLGLTNPTNRLEIQMEGRTGTHPSNLAMYISGNIGTASSGFEIRHSNGTQGVGLGYNSIYATGSNTDQDISLLSRGSTGQIYIISSSQVNVLASRLYVKPGTIRLERGNLDSQYWEIRSDSDANLYFSWNTTSRGYLLWYSDVGQIDFTGQHRCSSENIDMSQSSQYKGYIVSSTGILRNLTNNSSKPNINESLPIVSLSSKPFDKAVYGVISDCEDESTQRTYALGSFVSVFEKESNDTRLIINSLGEGAIWVCNINGNIENGDYITSSNVPGLGMKQDDDILHNYTVAKATTSVNFDNIETLENIYDIKFCNTDGILLDKQRYLQGLQNGEILYIMAFIGCTYHCG